MNYALQTINCSKIVPLGQLYSSVCIKYMKGMLNSLNILSYSLQPFYLESLSSRKKCTFTLDITTRSAAYNLLLQKGGLNCFFFSYGGLQPLRAGPGIRVPSSPTFDGKFRLEKMRACKVIGSNLPFYKLKSSFVIIAVRFAAGSSVTIFSCQEQDEKVPEPPSLY